MRNDVELPALELVGLDGGNPLGFLAALGTLRMVALALPDDEVRLSWVRHGSWRPVLHAPAAFDRKNLLQLLDRQLAKLLDHPALKLGDNLQVPPDKFRSFAERAAAAAMRTDRTWADLTVAFACDATTDEKAGTLVVQDSDFRTMSGSGHQHFLKFMRNIVAHTDEVHIEKALFEPWRYDDPLENQTMRWDPLDDQRYALRWRNPSGDPARRERGTVLGANRLAIEGLPLFPTAPVGNRLATTGFSGRSSRDCFWTWPIWQARLSLDVVRSVLALADLQRLEQREEGSEEAIARRRRDQEIRRARLNALGVSAVFRSQRLTIGKFRNFSPAHAV